MNCSFRERMRFPNGNRKRFPEFKCDDEFAAFVSDPPTKFEIQSLFIAQMVHVVCAHPYRSTVSPWLSVHVLPAFVSHDQITEWPMYNRGKETQFQVSWWNNNNKSRCSFQLWMCTDWDLQPDAMCGSCVCVFLSLWQPNKILIIYWASWV